MSALSDKIKKARRFTVQFEGHTLELIRPTDLEVMELQESEGGLNIRNSLPFVVGWDLVESDLVPGGDGKPVGFDKEAFIAWAEDKPELWSVVLGALADSYRIHAEKREEDSKN